MTETKLIEIRNLEVHRGTFSLKIPEFRTAPGEILGLVGPNGAGKTTLLEAIAGLRPLASGQVTVFGYDPFKRPEFVRSRLGIMNDSMPLFAMKIGSLLKLLSGYYATWDNDLVHKLLERFKLDPGMKVYQLSRGQGTRIRLITAMAFRPEILILDEPASGLDLEGRRSLLESVLEIVQDTDRSVIISSHGLADVERVSDRLLVLDQGRVVQDGATSELVGEDQTLEEALIAWRAAG